MRCAQQGHRGTCFEQPAAFKRVYRISISPDTAGQSVRKEAWTDLLNIADPDGKAARALNNGVISMPFANIEDVDVVDRTHIVVANDNNYPFSASRQPNRADDNEFLLLEVPDLLETHGKSWR